MARLVTGGALVVDEEAAVGGRGRLLALTLLAAAVLFLRAARRAAMLALRAKALALLSTGPAGFAGAALVVVVDGVVADGSAAPHRRFRLRSLALPSFGAVGLDDAVDGASDEDAMAATVVACFFLLSNQ